jgi:hypothetical protein
MDTTQPTVGQGVSNKLTLLGSSAATNEQYYSPSSNQNGLYERSFTWDSAGRLLVSFKQPDGSWQVQCFRNTGE